MVIVIGLKTITSLMKIMSYNEEPSDNDTWVATYIKTLMKTGNVQKNIVFYSI